jgi:hypothetical protein
VQELDNGHLGTVQRPARPVAALGLPGLTLNAQQIEGTDEGWLRRLQLDLPEDTRFVELTLPPAAGLRKAWVNGVPAMDTSIETKHGPRQPTLRLYYPGDGPVNVELLTESGGPLSAAAVTWHDLPGLLTAPFMGNWPEDAQPNRYGPRAEKIQRLELVAEEEPKAEEGKQDIL